jgi:hypothetical protein
MSSVGGRDPAVPAIWTAVVEGLREERGEESVDCPADGPLSFEGEVDRPRGWASVGTRCEKRFVRAEGLLLVSGAGTGEGSVRTALNHGFVAMVGSGGVAAAGCGVGAAGPWVVVVVWELCSRERMWVWV